MSGTVVLATEERCPKCDRKSIVTWQRSRDGFDTPRCPLCGAWLRPYRPRYWDAGEFEGQIFKREEDER